MAKVYLCEINEAINFLSRCPFDTESGVSSNINTQLDEFINNSTGLVGEQWNMYKTKLSSYKSIFAKKNTAITNFRSEVLSALSEMKNFMGSEYDYLDSSMYDAIVAEQRKCQGSLNYYQGLLNNNDELIKDETNKRIAQANIQKYNDLLREIEKHLIKLKDFDSVYSRCLGKINSAYSSINEFTGEVNSLTVSNCVVFKV